jgi:hypothetical protein
MGDLEKYRQLYPDLTVDMVLSTDCPACQAHYNERCRVLTYLDDCPSVPLPITGGFHMMRMSRAAREHELRPTITVTTVMPATASENSLPQLEKWFRTWMKDELQLLKDEGKI